MTYQNEYTSPDALMGDQSLSRDEKISMLESWREDKKAYLRAASEGMEGDNTHAALLKEIKKALKTLQERP